MTGEILEKLQQITPEEQRILSGEKTIEKEIYMEENSNVIDATKLLEAGKLIQVRTHTRFIHFPEHTHNYVEMIYMCSGSTHHVINGDGCDFKAGRTAYFKPECRAGDLSGRRRGCGSEFYHSSGIF